MTTYHITITGDKYPTEYTVTAGKWRAAVSRAVQEWQKRSKGSRTKTLRILAVKSDVQVTEENGA